MFHPYLNAITKMVEAKLQRLSFKSYEFCFYLGFSSYFKDLILQGILNILVRVKFLYPNIIYDKLILINVTVFYITYFLLLTSVVTLTEVNK